MNPWTQQDVDDLKKKGINERKNRISNSATISTSNLEHHPSDELAHKEKTCRFDPSRSFKVRATQYRRRLTDIDGGSIKAVLDAIVRAGVVKDDSPEIIKSLEIRQFKI